MSQKMQKMQKMLKKMLKKIDFSPKAENWEGGTGRGWGVASGFI
jgi:hypothetical protein